ncbi:hypothetical protein SteCoe_38001 [Stentor coeruleus]|uniref:C2H2-type domain-containing protein n=1 Tax=Stentor coeruleus TaxID=5963 RepID=A0A1R2AMA8_9CILI|nr:hypothetical protein SteCoe_38001 [Stentor coeruleus]
MQSIFIGKEPKIFTCEICDKTFPDKSKLSRHLLVHTKEKPFKCSFCSKYFSLDYNLRTHIRVHSGDKPFICQVPGCNKRFSQSSNKKVHERSHIRKDRRISSSKDNFSVEEVWKPETKPTMEICRENTQSSSISASVKSEDIKPPAKTDTYKDLTETSSCYENLFVFSYLEF